MHLATTTLVHQALDQLRLDKVGAQDDEDAEEFLGESVAVHHCKSGTIKAVLDKEEVFHERRDTMAFSGIFGQEGCPDRSITVDAKEIVDHLLHIIARNVEHKVEVFHRPLELLTLEEGSSRGSRQLWCFSKPTSGRRDVKVSQAMGIPVANAANHRIPHRPILERQVRRH